MFKTLSHTIFNTSWKVQHIPSHHITLLRCWPAVGHQQTDLTHSHISQTRTHTPSSYDDISTTGNLFAQFDHPNTSDVKPYIHYTTLHWDSIFRPWEMNDKHVWTGNDSTSTNTQDFSCVRNPNLCKRPTSHPKPIRELYHQTDFLTETVDREMSDHSLIFIHCRINHRNHSQLSWAKLNWLDPLGSDSQAS